MASANPGQGAVEGKPPLYSTAEHFLAQGREILTLKSSDPQILSRQRGEQITPLPVFKYGLFWAKSDLWARREKLYTIWRKEPTFPFFLPFLYFFFISFLMVSPILDQIARKMMGFE